MDKTVIAVNGSPRKNWNTATLLGKALEGAAAQGAATELVHLYDLNYKGCISCFSCKRRGGPSYGKCALQDDLTLVLAKIATADALILGSPLYYQTVSGEMKSFLERLMFPYSVYGHPEPYTLFPRKIQIGFIYTMNATDEQIKNVGGQERVASHEMILEMIFGNWETLFSTDTYQFEDYSQFVSDYFNPEAKAKQRAEVFPRDCEKAYEMGARFAEKSCNEK
ncbi:hypothetical protein SPSIL_036250 [Sporomusa silvacetica DSM 10669]|uniref:NADPH-dependent FMN reductase-like domain-containing protein n=1 Tax=Sporomusa silvacetica DSM 10669 TaxID=1123289 RepID=A0ABZ3IPE0_9FIRM|nr:flavodoxin family protein [Sporomusa silvacetica]OZC19808.1 2-amino-4-deoxychorismate dehydrogenase [Sporomusa silvacetica DSM 10669]